MTGHLLMESDAYELTPEDITEQETELEAPSDEETEYTEEDYGDDFLRRQL